MSLQLICLTVSRYLALEALQLLIIGQDSVRYLIPQGFCWVHAHEKGNHSLILLLLPPRFWNKLPIQLREAVSVPVFNSFVGNAAHLYQC